MTTTSADHRRVRVGTIVWGAILVAVAVFAFFAAQFGIGPSGPAALLWTIVGFGGLLVVAAIVTAIVRSVASSRATVSMTEPVLSEAEESHPPID